MRTSLFSPPGHRRSLSVQAQKNVARSIENGESLPSLIVHHNRPAGSGRNGNVFHATLVVEDSTYHQTIRMPCIAKQSQSHSEQSYAMHNLLTQNSASADSGLLTLIATLPDSQNPTTKYLVLPACELTLSDCIQEIANHIRHKDPALFQTIVIDMLEKLALALRALLAKQKIHRDVKPENIGIRNGVFCLFDFDGLISYEDFSNSTSLEGSPVYLAPELFSGNRDFPQVTDYYALGQIVRQLLGMPFTHIPDTLKGDESDLQTLLTQKQLAYESGKSGKIPPPGNPEESTNFEDCLAKLQDALCHPDPTHRANEETLLATIERLKSLAPHHDDSKQKNKMRDFFLETEKTKLKASIYPLTADKAATPPQKRSPSSAVRQACNEAEVNVVIGSRSAGRGANGSVRHGSTLIPDTETETAHREACVIKTIRDNKKQISLHKKLTENETTKSSGILKHVATVGDQYQVLPPCELILSDCLETITALKNSDPTLFEAIIIELFERFIIGLTTLEQQGIVHLDLKPENIGRRNNLWCLFDLDAAKTFEQYRSLESAIGTVLYMPPEVLTNSIGKDYSPTATDIFSLGLILRQLCGSPLHASQDITKADNDFTRYYLLAQQYTQIKANPSASVDLDAAVNTSTKFQTLLEDLHKSMTHVLPEQRPNLNTLNNVLAKLKELSPKHADPEIKAAIQKTFLAAEATKSNAQPQLLSRCSTIHSTKSSTDSFDSVESFACGMAENFGSHSEDHSPHPVNQTRTYKFEAKIPEQTIAAPTSTKKCKEADSTKKHKKTENNPTIYNPGGNRFALLAKIGNKHPLLNEDQKKRKNKQPGVAIPAKLR